MNIRTQMAFFEKKNPITIRRQFENKIISRPTVQKKTYKNNIQINYHNISTKALDIPDIFSHSIEKRKKINISSYNKATQQRIKQSKSQEKNINNRIKNRKDLFNFPINNNFSLSNINYFPNKRNNNNKNTIANSISTNNNNNDILKEMFNKNKNINLSNNMNKNTNISTSLPKIKIKRNPLSKNINDKDIEKEKNKIIKEKRANSQRNINYNIINTNSNKQKTEFKLNENNNKQISLDDLLNEYYPLYQSAKHSENSFDKIISYGVNTYKGTIRQYNEDRVTILINATMNKNIYNNNFQKISYFSIYDGHAGNKCCEYLKTYLHHYIFDSDFFPQNPIKAIEQGFKNCEHNFLNSINVKNQYIDSSGSCAIIILIINDSCYIVNLGDSRALYSFDNGKKFFQLSRDHKPNDPIEKKRIYKAGGNIYKTNLQQIMENGMGFKTKESLVNLPYRILPGRLSVSYFLIL